MKPVDRIAQRHGFIHFNIRLHLSHNTADILPAVHRPDICTGRYHAGLPSCNAADIVSGMLIPDPAIIGTPDNHAVGIARDTPCVHTAENLRLGFRDTDAEEDSHTHFIVFLHPFAVIVNTGTVNAVRQGAMVLSGNTARGIISRYASPGKTIPHRAHTLVYTHQSADGGFPADRPLETAFLDGAVIDAAQTADTFLFIRCNDFPF